MKSLNRLESWHFARCDCLCIIDDAKLMGCFPCAQLVMHYDDWCRFCDKETEDSENNERRVVHKEQIKIYWNQFFVVCEWTWIVWTRPKLNVTRIRVWIASFFWITMEWNMFFYWAWSSKMFFSNSIIIWKTGGRSYSGDKWNSGDLHKYMKSQGVFESFSRCCWTHPFKTQEWP